MMMMMMMTIFLPTATAKHAWQTNTFRHEFALSNDSMYHQLQYSESTHCSESTHSRRFAETGGKLMTMRCGKLGRTRHGVGGGPCGDGTESGRRGSCDGIGDGIEGGACECGGSSTTCSCSTCCSRPRGGSSGSGGGVSIM
eukprot:478059-Karenia_brevis.AAC.1